MARDAAFAHMIRTAQHADAKGFKEFSKRLIDNGR